MCEYTQKCWRYAYSRWFLEKEKYKLADAPKRDILFFSGYATIDMMPRRGIYAENFPCLEAPQCLCPHLTHSDEGMCEEKQKESKRLAQMEKNRMRKASWSNQTPRVNISKELRYRVAQRYCYTCVYCGSHQNALDAYGKKISCVVDHFIPLARGGENTEENLVLACRACNREKSTEIWKMGQKMMEKTQ